MTENTSQKSSKNSITPWLLVTLGLIVLNCLLCIGIFFLIRSIGNRSFAENGVQAHNVFRLTYLDNLSSDSSVLSVTWSPDGSMIAASYEDNTIRLWDIASSEIITEQAQEYRVDQLAWSPDSTKLLAVQSNAKTVIWDISDQTTWSKEWTLTGTRCAAWSPDGSMIASGSILGKVKIWDTATWDEILEIDGNTGSIESIAWSPVGSLVAFGGKPSGMQIWEIESGTTGTDPQASYSANITFGFPGDTLARPLQKEGLAWSSDGSQIAANSIGYEIQIWDSSSGEALTEMSEYSIQADSIAWSPNGAVLSAVQDSYIYFWDASNGEFLRYTWARETDGINSTAWSPDSTMLAIGSSSGTIFILGGP